MIGYIDIMKLPFIQKLRAPKISVLRLMGTISATSRDAGLSDERVRRLLDKAMSGKIQALALAINSPGGSPVQSALICERIRAEAARKKIPVFSFVEDVGASGGYWLALSGDEIYADAASIIGSIGVVSGSFGFPEALKKLGVERRVYTAGKSKVTMDPFKPENPKEVKEFNTKLGMLHDHFIDHVKTRRAGKLADDAEIFSGAYWTGQKALELGLIDGIGHLEPILRERFGDQARFKYIQRKQSLFSRFGMNVTNSAIANIEERIEFNRFGC